MENNSNYYQPNGRDDKGMSDAIVNDIAFKRKKVKVYGNEFDFNFPQHNDTPIRKVDFKINGKKPDIPCSVGNMNAFFYEQIEKPLVKVNDNIGFVRPTSISLGNDLSVTSVDLETNKYGLETENNAISINNNIRYNYDENQNIIGHSNYESYTVSELAGLTFKEKEIPNDASEETKKQIQYRNQQFRKLCNFFNSIEKSSLKKVDLPEIMFIGDDVYLWDKGIKEHQSLYKYSKKENNKYQLETAVDLGNRITAVSFDKNNDVFYIEQQTYEGTIIRVLNRKNMSFIEKKKIENNDYQQLHRFFARTTNRGERVFYLMDENVFDKKQKEYFDKQVKKEQALNQGQVDNNIEKQAQISLKSKEKNTKCSIF